mmetsp:Transcript_29261/g.51214  ORF Transcript_29261/g.51214 Transcript_29261/m.51214 type:complete len:376 (-) Transcript_29261:143-1270(-)
MISYNGGLLGLGLCDLFRITGSVVPKALFWSLPSSAIAAGLWFYFRGDDEGSSKPVSRVYNGYSFILGFMIVFRMQQGYTRFWEAATLTNELRSEWLDCVQNLFAFTSNAKEKQAEVEKFQHLVIRLISMLHRSALERLNLNEKTVFPIIDNSGIGSAELEFLGANTDRCEIMYSWLLKIIMSNMKSGVIAIPPPVLGRAFQELGTGMAKLHNVMKITTIPIPFPYVQMSSFLLLFHWVLTPIIASLIMKNHKWAACLAFMGVFCLWAIYYIAAEIEQPFGTHKNCLPCFDMQEELNRILIVLLDPQSQEPPEFNLEEQKANSGGELKTVNTVKSRTARKTEKQAIAEKRKTMMESGSGIMKMGTGEGPKAAWDS